MIIKHGDSQKCGSCGKAGRVDNSPSDDGPEFEDWIGATGGYPVCHKCFDGKAHG